MTIGVAGVADRRPRLLSSACAMLILLVLLSDGHVDHSIRLLFRLGQLLRFQIDARRAVVLLEFRLLSIPVFAMVDLLRSKDILLLTCILVMLHIFNVLILLLHLTALSFGEEGAASFEAVHFHALIRLLLLALLVGFLHLLARLTVT